MFRFSIFFLFLFFIILFLTFYSLRFALFSLLIYFAVIFPFKFYIVTLYLYYALSVWYIVKRERGVSVILSETTCMLLCVTPLKLCAQHKHTYTHKITFGSSIKKEQRPCPYKIHSKIFLFRNELLD